MTDHEIRSLSRALFALPVAERHRSRLVLDLDAALRRGGILGDSARLPEVGRVVHEAGLDVEWLSGEERERTVSLGRVFPAFDHSPEGRASAEREHVEWMRKHVHVERSYQDRQWMDRVEFEPEDDHKLWVAWDAPPVGRVVQRFWETHKDGTARFMIVRGAACDSLVRTHLHEETCSSCDCFELSWVLGDWIGDVYYRNERGEISRTVGSGMDSEGFCTDYQPPWCVRPSRFRPPLDFVRPSLRLLVSAG